MTLNAKAAFTLDARCLSRSKFSLSTVALVLGISQGAALKHQLPHKLTYHVSVVYLPQSNFLQAFLSVPVPKVGGGKATAGASGGGGSSSLLGLWLRLLVSLSFGEDGQQSILRVTGALELLADLALNRRHALLILHNLCFCPANKPHVLANGMEVCRGGRELDLVKDKPK